MLGKGVRFPLVRGPRPRRLVVAALAILVGMHAGAAQAGTALFAVSVGFNGSPPDGSADAVAAPLRFADDDAVAFHQFLRSISRRSYLLAAPDRDTRAQFPDLVGEARLPSLRELAAVIADLDHQLAAAAAAGDETAVIIFYSGHGTIGQDGHGPHS
jgi:hypothetical protein